MNETYFSYFLLIPQVAKLSFLQDRLPGDELAFLYLSDVHWGAETQLMSVQESREERVFKSS